MHDLTEFQKWAVGEYFGALLDKNVVSVYVMSGMAEGEGRRIYVRYEGHPHKGKIALCDESSFAAAVQWWNQVTTVQRQQSGGVTGKWYVPMTSPHATTCMWCGEPLSSEEVDEHEQQCGG